MTAQYNKIDFHYIRYGIASDQKYLLEYLNKYGTLIINAKTVAHTPKSLFSFLNKISGKAEFIIDPETHAFQHDRANIESKSKNNRGRNIIKKSILGLINSYGNPIDKVIKSGRILIASDFDSRNISPFCKRVIDFQLNTIKKQELESDVAEYYEFLKEKKKITSRSLFPSVVIAPYFYLHDYDYEEWLNLNMKCIDATISIMKASSIELAAELVLSQETLSDESKMKVIIEAYNSIKVNKIFLWIDAFSEHETSLKSLFNYKSFLKNINKQVVNLHGGYLSLLLRKTGVCTNLIGVAHGLGYGEERSVVPVGGGVPTAKYYLPPLHKRLIYRNALRSIEGLGGIKDKLSYSKNICDCDLCQNLINKPSIDFKYYGKMKISTKDGKEYPTADTIEYCMRHYMNSKIKEYFESVNFNNVKYSLGNTYKKLKNFLSENDISHCLKWIRVIEEDTFE